MQVCDHAKWASALGLQRIIHTMERNKQQGTECAPRARAQPALQLRPQCLRSTLAAAACPCKHAWGLV
jgi:hypothetical protein